MHLTINSPSGPRPAVSPSMGNFPRHALASSGDDCRPADVDDVSGHAVGSPAGEEGDDTTDLGYIHAGQFTGRHYPPRAIRASCRPI